MALTDKQQSFLEHYLTCWNASEAVRRMGYTGKRANRAGQDYLSKPDIQAAIKQRLTELQMSADEVLARLTAQARADLSDFIDVREPGKGIEQAADMVDAHAIAGGWKLNLIKAEKAGKLGLVKKIKAGQWGPEIELYDAQAALALLARHHGLLVERTEHTIDILGDAAAALDRKLLPALAESAPADIPGDADDG